jgi:UDP-MurNAc hydroxylase
MKVTYYYSACVAMTTEDVSILCDPWFTEGIYDGAWFHYPPVEDPLGLIGQHDVVYVSHIHPDHYDPVFLRRYLARFPATRIMIADFPENFLARKMTADGFEPRITNDVRFGDTQVRLFPNGIDSALAMKRRQHSIVNMNDNPFDAQQIASVLDFTGQPDIALLSHTGAGPYPQTYFDIGPVLETAARRKHEDFLARYLRARNALHPRCAIPFAGQYVLGGRLAHLNPYRGVSDPVDVLAIDERAVVLAEGAAIDAETLTPTAVRTTPFPPEDIAGYALGLSSAPMAYEKAFAGIEADQVPWKPLLNAAYRNALRRLVQDKDWSICIRLPATWFCMRLSNSCPHTEFVTNPANIEPRSEIYIDHRYLFGLLTRYYHWNNAEIGSQYMTRRYPDRFDRGVQGFLNFFHV